MYFFQCLWQKKNVLKTFAWLVWEPDKVAMFFTRKHIIIHDNAAKLGAKAEWDNSVCVFNEMAINIGCIVKKVINLSYVFSERLLGHVRYSAELYFSKHFLAAVLFLL